MQDTAQPSTANIAMACAILAGVTGYMLGQAKSLGLFGGSPVSTPTQGKEKAHEDSEASSDDESDDDTAPADFKGNSEECKMVLVVRTDLGMTKGVYKCIDILEAMLTHHRQDWRAMRARDPRLLQTLSPHRPKLAGTAPLGIAGPGQGGSAGQERRGARDAAGASAEPGTGSAHHPRRRTDTDCERERDRAGHRACAKERDRPGHGTSKVAVKAKLLQTKQDGRNWYVADWVCPKHQWPTA